MTREPTGGDGRQKSMRSPTRPLPVSRRVALAAAALVLGLSACGDPSTSSTPTSMPPVIQIAGGAAANEAGAALDAAPRSMMPWGLITYEYQGAFPALAEYATAWSFPAGPSIDPGRVAALAQVLGVAGEVRALPADQGGGWMVGSPDYTGASLYVSSDAMGSWWFNPDPSVWGPQVECVTSEVVDPMAGGGTDAAPPPDDKGVDGVAEPCPEPQPPSGVPTAEEARARAEALFTELGYDPAQYEFETYADEWGAYVTAFRLLDGMRSPMTLSAGFGGQGAVTWAGGSLAQPVRGADYPLVGPQAGLERLNDQSQLWSGLGYGYAAYDSVAGGAMRSAGTASAPMTDAPVTTVEGDVLIDPMPPECDPSGNCTWPEPEPVTITLTGVRMDMTMVWDVSGTVWLLPAYTFTNGDGAQATVLAVADGFVELPEQLPVPEPAPLPEPAPVESTPVDTIDDVVADAELAARLVVGVTEDEAAKLLAEPGWEMRVVERDGESLAVTMDLRMNRVNVAVVDGVVTAVVSIG